MDFKLDTVELTPLGFFGWPFHVHSGAKYALGKTRSSRQRRGFGTTRCETPAHPAFVAICRSPTEAWRRGRMCSEAILSRPSSTDGGRIEKYVVGGSLKRMKLSVRAGQSVTLNFSAARCDVHQHSRFYTSSAQSRHSLLRGPPRQLLNFGNRIGRLFAGKICCGNAIEVLLAWMMWRHERVASCIPADLNFSWWTAVLAKTESSP